MASEHSLIVLNSNLHIVKSVNTIIIFSGYIGLLNSVLRYIMPIALIFYGWNLNDYATIYIFQALSMALPYIFGGFLSDFKGRKETIIIGIGIYIIGIITLLLSINGTSLFTIILGRMITTISNGMVQIGISTILVDETIEGQQRTHAFGLNFSLRNAMGLIGPIFFGLLLTGFSESYEFSLFSLDSYESVFVLLLLLGVGSYLLVSKLPKTDNKFLLENKEAKLSDMSKNQLIMNKAFLSEEIMIGILSGAIVPFINYYVISTFNPSDIIWAVIFGISNSSIAIGNFFVGKYAERIGKGKITVILNALAPIFALGIALSPSLLIVSIFYIFRSAFANAVQPAWQSWYFSHTIKSARGRSYSVIQVSRRLGRSAGTAVGSSAFTLLGVFSFPIIGLFYPIAMLIPYLKEKNLK